MPKMIKDGLEGKITNIICSPPYNAGKDYGKNHDDNLPYHKYLKWLGKVIELSAKLLRKGGRLIWIVGDVGNRQNENGDSYCHNIYVDLINMGRELDCGLKFRDSVIWAKGNRGSIGTAYGSYRSASSPIIRSNHEHIMIWSKDQWDLPNISGSKPDITKEEFLNWTFSAWTINPVGNKKAKHPCVYPP